MKRADAFLFRYVWFALASLWIAVHVLQVRLILESGEVLGFPFHPLILVLILGVSMVTYDRSTHTQRLVASFVLGWLVWLLAPILTHVASLSLASSWWLILVCGLFSMLLPMLMFVIDWRNWRLQATKR